ncbi:hypothetical protein CEXT_186441 [Caerostris extrusa]|uniref:Uncharacterized protein n=1 Tax=Caerostris extrusa TaxID=172846 RepID=A0AAV4VME7_CAEEX|nr:hypothetical protein CEXT_186441 [Caerostris extrusa]
MTEFAERQVKNSFSSCIQRTSDCSPSFCHRMKRQTARRARTTLFAKVREALIFHALFPYRCLPKRYYCHGPLLFRVVFKICANLSVGVQNCNDIQCSQGICGAIFLSLFQWYIQG